MGDTSLQQENFRPAMVWHMQSQRYTEKPSATFNSDKRFSYSNTDIDSTNYDEGIQSRSWSLLNALTRGFNPYRYTEKGTSHPTEPYDKIGSGAVLDKADIGKELKAMWEQFGNDTTIHGVKQIGNKTRNRISRFVWLTLVCISAAVLSYTVGNLMIEYYQYNTVTKVETKIMTAWPFPSVTVCNLCPFSKKSDTPTTTRFLETMLASTSVLNMSLTSMGLNMTDPGMLEVLHMPIVDLYEKYSFNLDEMILFATYNGEMINITERFEKKETAYGRCFTFNGPKYIEEYNVSMTTQDGRLSGLQFYVYIHQDDYFIYGDITAGIRVYISHHPETPRIKNDGVDIHPGMSTRVALNPVTYTFLPKPYKSYGDQHCQEMPALDVYNKMVNATFYSYERCLDQCMIYTATLNCSCSTIGSYVVGYEKCTFLQYSNCISPFVNKFHQTGVHTCDCPRPCTFTKYDIAMSSSQLPSKVSASELAKLFKRNFSLETIRENFVDVRVYMDSMLAKTVRHEPQYTIGSIVAFLGGQMGFFLGASLITMAELLETLAVTGYVFFINKIVKLGQLRPKRRDNKVQAWIK